MLIKICDRLFWNSLQIYKKLNDKGYQKTANVFFFLAEEFATGYYFFGGKDDDI